MCFLIDKKDKFRKYNCSDTSTNILYIVVRIECKYTDFISTTNGEYEQGEYYCEYCELYIKVTTKNVEVDASKCKYELQTTYEFYYKSNGKNAHDNIVLNGQKLVFENIIS